MSSYDTILTRFEKKFYDDTFFSKFKYKNDTILKKIIFYNDTKMKF